jgi:outer membrane immunogenic protein
MRTNTKFALSSVAGLGIAAIAAMPAYAADVVFEEPPAPAAPVVTAPVSSWAGPYAGVQAGYGFNGDVSDPGADIETDGFLGGVFGGFNWQNGSFVYGVEGDVNYSTMDGESGGVDARTTFDGSLRARAGVAVTPNLLVYGTAGAAGERLELESGGVEDTQTGFGYTVGAGVDAKLTEQVFARAEYRYTDYGEDTFNFGGVDREFDSSNHRVTVGLGIKF